MDRTLLENYIQGLRSLAFFADESVPESFEYMLSYYRRHARKKRAWFRIFSVSVIILGVLLPVVAAFGAGFRLLRWNLNKDLAVAVLSALIALLTGLLSHFRWEVAWRGQTEALFALQDLRAEWESALIRARALPNEDRAIEFVAGAFHHFRSKTFEVVRAEMGNFFQVTQAPARQPEK